MNIRRAILKAADSIECDPYQFLSNYKPDCDTPGCGLGYVGLHLGVSEVNGRRYPVLVAEVMGMDCDMEFYGRMDGLNIKNWQCDKIQCIKAMRLYADKYHPERAKQGTPESVLSIFEERIAA